MNTANGDELVLKTLESMVSHQKETVLTLAKRLVPYVTCEDVLQPQDYPEIYYNVDFRYEEGLLHGLESALTAARAQMKLKEMKNGF